MLGFSKLINKTILVGITYVDRNNDLIENKTIFGKIVSVDNTEIKILNHFSKEFYCLPPDLSAIKKADPGIYTIKENGFSISNPDYISLWTVEKR